MQLSAKALIKPFDAMTLAPNADGSNPTEDVPTSDEDMVDLDIDDEGEEVDEDPAEDNNERDYEEDDEENPLAELDDDAREQLLEDTAAIRTTLNKVRCDIMFTLLHLIYILDS
jgi:hypothetical protein